MSAQSRKRNSRRSIDLRDPMYRIGRPKLTAGPNISDTEVKTGLDLYACREILIQEVWQRHFRDGKSILDGPTPWMAAKINSVLSAEDLRVYHATAGVFGALLAPKDMVCIEPLAKEIEYLGARMIAYGGYPAWTLHPALAGIHFFGMRLAHFILAGDLGRNFLDLLPHRGSRIAGAIRRRDTDYLLDILQVLEESLRNFHFDWESMNRDDRFWEILHALIDANNQSGYEDIFVCYDDDAWRKYNGTLSWWFDTGANLLGYDDYDDSSDDSDYDEGDDGY